MIIRKPIEFLWDEGNQQKNWLKHKVKTKECEEVFLDDQKKIAKEIPTKLKTTINEITKALNGVLLFILTFMQKLIPMSEGTLYCES